VEPCITRIVNDPVSTQTLTRLGITRTGQRTRCDGKAASMTSCAAKKYSFPAWCQDTGGTGGSACAAQIQVEVRYSLLDASIPPTLVITKNGQFALIFIQLLHHKKFLNRSCYTCQGNLNRDDLLLFSYQIRNGSNGPFGIFRNNLTTKDQHFITTNIHQVHQTTAILINRLLDCLFFP
jgi:hypothetical protein